ncbi:MAG TPA: RNA polymerase sigma factor RpoD, partial [Rubrobacteraceae bacterium]|nr:RNA polymerase sigma factor RpoD [Rubrobacteraceae bacterium]
KGRAIRVPVHMAEKVRKTGRAFGELSSEYGREPTEEDISRERVRQIQSKTERLLQTGECG